MTPKVLIVEDDLPNRQVIRYILTKFCDCDVYEAEDGLPALELLSQHRFELIISDLQMPGMDGLALTRVVRQRWAGTYVILLTAHASVATVEEALRGGVDDVWFKPIRVLETIGKVKEILAGQVSTKYKPEANSATVTQKPTLLIMDDDLAMQTVLEIALREAGYNVVLANDGLEGIEKLRTLKPDLVISDIVMPGMDGIETFQRIKERLQDDGIPIFIMTALNRKPWFTDLEAEGAVILQKPFDIGQFLQLIDDMLGEDEVLSSLERVAATGDQALVLISTTHVDIHIEALISNKVICLPNVHYIYPTSESEAIAIVPMVDVEEDIRAMVERFYEQLSPSNTEARLSFAWSSGPDVSVNDLIEDAAQELIERRAAQGIPSTHAPDILQYQIGRGSLEQQFKQVCTRLTEVERRLTVNEFIREDHLRSEIEQMTAVFNHDLTGGLVALRDVIARVSAQAHALPFEIHQVISRMHQHVQICVAWQRSVMELGSGKATQSQKLELATFLNDTLSMVKGHFNLSIEICIKPTATTLVSVDTEAILVTCLHYMIAAQFAAAQSLSIAVNYGSSPNDFTIVFEDDGTAVQRELALNIHSPFILNPRLPLPIRVLALLPRMLAQQNIALRTATNDRRFVTVLEQKTDKVIISVDELRQRIAEITEQISSLESRINTNVARQRRNIANARDIAAPYIRQIEQHVDAIVVHSRPLQSIKLLSPVETQRIHQLSLYCYLLVRNITLALQGTTLPVEIVDINGQIREVIEILGHKLSHVHTTLDLAQTSPFVSIASVEIKQVLMNVIRNAAEATKPGGQVSIATQTFSDHVTISIHDTGAGIHANYRNNIFKLHFSTKGRGKNSGVGLYAVATIVKRAGGYIRIASAYIDEGKMRFWRRGFRRALQWPSTGTLLEIEFPTSREGTDNADTSSHTSS